MWICNWLETGWLGVKAAFLGQYQWRAEPYGHVGEVWQVLIHVDNLSSSTQKVLCGALLATNDTDLLGELADRDDLDAGVREILLRNGNATVKCRVLQRNDVTDSELAMVADSDDEHVQTLLAQRYAHRPAIWQMITGSPTSEALMSLAENRDAEMEIRKLALTMALVSRGADGEMSVNMYFRVAGLLVYPWACDIMVKNVVTVADMDLLNHHTKHFPNNTQQQLYGAKLATLANDIAVGDSNVDDLLVMLTQALTTLWVCEETVDSVEYVIDRLERELDATTESRELQAIYRNTLQDLRHLVAVNRQRPLADLRAEVSLADNKTASGLTESILRDPRAPLREPLCTELLGQAGLTWHTLADIWALFQLETHLYADYKRALGKLLNQDVSDDLQVLGALVGVKAAATSRVQTKVIAALTDNSTHIDVRWPEAFTVFGPYLQPEQLIQLPTTVVRRAAALCNEEKPWTSTQQSFVRALGGVLDGLDMAVWLNLAKLAPDYTGPFGDLVATCKAAVQ